MTAAVAVAADRVGRRHTLVIVSVLTGIGFIAATSSAQLAILIPASFIGMLNGMGRDRGPAGTLEQAILPGTTDAAHRTWTLAWYNLVLDCGHAFGGLAAALPASHRLMFGLCAGSALLCTAPYAALSRHVEVASAARTSEVRATADWDDRQTNRAVAKLGALFGIDSLGGGFLSSALIAYWFFERYGFSERELALLFFAARLLNAASHVAAAWLAKRIGLLNTMVLTHLPSSVLLMAAPAAPSGALAAGLFLGRESLVEMDVPTRQSYVMAVVRPEERLVASGVTHLVRLAGWAAGPVIGGLLMQDVALGTPFVVAAAMKITYDVLLWIGFRRHRAPEETARA